MMTVSLAAAVGVGPSPEAVLANVHVPVFTRLRWAALVALMPELAVDLIPDFAVPAISLLAEDAREWLLAHPISPEFRFDIQHAPLELDLIAAAVAHGRAVGEAWSPRATCQRLGLLHERAPEPAAAPTWSPAQALAVEGLEALGNVARTLGAAVAASDPQRFTAARPTLEPAMIAAMERLNAWEESCPAGAEQVHLAYPWAS